MRNRICLDYSFTFGDHQAKVSNEAKLYYITLMFHAEHGFVASPIQVLDSMGLDKSIMYELINNGELLTLPNRDEVFITSYFVHNPTFDRREWLKSPYSTYWRGKLWIKDNGIATLKVKEIPDEIDDIVITPNTEDDDDLPM